MKRLMAGLIIGIFMAVPAAVVKAEDAAIHKGKQVKLDYILTVDGQVMDTSEGKAPIEFVQGQGQIIPGLEKQLEGLKAGEAKTINVVYTEAYGAFDPKAFQEVPKTLFPLNVDIKVGMMLPLLDKEGKSFPATVQEIKKDTVVLNMNHPLEIGRAHVSTPV